MEHVKRLLLAMFAVAFTAYVLLSLSPAFAQDELGSIAGVITAPNGAVVVGAPVRARHVETSALFRAASSTNGRYTLAQVPAGTYELSVNIPGFRFAPWARHDIRLQRRQTLSVDVRLDGGPALPALTAGSGPVVVGPADTGGAGPGRAASPTGPVPRTPDGRPDFSGVWSSGREPDPEPPAMLPWAAAVTRERIDNAYKDQPTARCLPFGIPLLGPYIYKIVQTPTLLVMIFEQDTPGLRQVFLDDRGHPQDLFPTWMGHSIGRWEGDTLVVDTIGFNDKTWVTLFGHPHTEQMRVTERYRRRDASHLEIAITIEDSAAYSRPWRINLVSDLRPNVEIQEFICNENNRYQSLVQ